MCTIPSSGMLSAKAKVVRPKNVPNSNTCFGPHVSNRRDEQQALKRRGSAGALLKREWGRIPRAPREVHPEEMKKTF